MESNPGLKFYICKKIVLPGINTSKQSINTAIILIGAGLLLYDFMSSPEHAYLKIAGLVILMFGLYKSTKQWSSDNTSTENQKEDDSSKDD